MSTPTVNRFPFEPHIAKLEPQVQYVLKNLWNVAFDAQNAVPILKAQIDANKSAVASVTNTVTNNSTASETIIQQIVSAYGTVNNQSGNVAYSTTQSDASAFIILSDASPVAVSLTAAPVITLPWACVLVNEGVGLVTATPASGTISYPNNIAAASMPVAQGQAAIICFDGTNFFSVIIAVQPQNTPSIVHQWITAYNSITGVFSQSQPAVGDVTGAAPIASPTFTGTVTEPTPPVLTAAVTATSATAGAASALPLTPLGYLDWSVNGVTVKVPFYSV